MGLSGYALESMDPMMIVSDITFGMNLLIKKKKNLWDELKEVQQRWSIPWCLLRDFNVVRFPSEQLERSRFSSAMFEFFEFIVELNLLDLCL